jgi:hypothetical protein
MHPRCSRNAVREKPGMAGAWDMPAGMPCARDKLAGMFVVSGKILVRCQEDRRTLEEQMDVWRDRQTEKINTPSLYARNVEDLVDED